MQLLGKRPANNTVVLCHGPSPLPIPGLALGSAKSVKHYMLGFPILSQHLLPSGLLISFLDIGV